jgi:hypothetical protein
MFCGAFHSSIFSVFELKSIGIETVKQWATLQTRGRQQRSAAHQAAAAREEEGEKEKERERVKEGQ